MKKLIAIILAASLLLNGCEAGNKEDKEKEKMLTFNVAGSTMRIEVCAKNIIRVQSFPSGEINLRG